MLLPGDPAPFFSAPSSVNPKFNFDTVAGRYVVLSFFASSTHAFSHKMLDDINAHRNRFDVANAVFFGVSVDPADKDRLKQEVPGVMYFWDFDQAISKKYGLDQPMPGASPSPTPEPGQSVYHPRTYILDHALRIVAIIPFGGEPANHVTEVIRILDSLPKLETVPNPAPVLLIPFVFDPQLCKTLIEYYNSHGGEDSGFMRDVGGKTVGITDYSHKRRADCEIKDETLIRATQECVLRRIVPAIKQAYQFNVTRIERHIVACYEAETGGHFKAHRDNTTMGTAHRRFAVSINLNADEFDGGELWFPEFSRRLYKPPTGGACVFSCSLLHEATKVTRGKRYACLPFLYDDAAAAIRERNRQYVGNAGPKPEPTPQPAQPAST